MTNRDSPIRPTVVHTLRPDAPCDTNLLARILSGASVGRAIGVLTNPYYAIRTGISVKGLGS